MPRFGLWRRTNGSSVGKSPSSAGASASGRLLASARSSGRRRWVSASSTRAASGTGRRAHGCGASRHGSEIGPHPACRCARQVHTVTHGSHLARHAAVAARHHVQLPAVGQREHYKLRRERTGDVAATGRSQLHRRFVIMACQYFDLKHRHIYLRLEEYVCSRVHFIFRSQVSFGTTFFVIV